MMINTLALDGWALTFYTVRWTPRPCFPSNTTAPPSVAKVQTSYYLLWHRFVKKNQEVFVGEMQW